MADEATTTVSTEGTQATDDKATTTSATTGDATGTNSGQQERTFTASEIEGIVKDRLARDREARAKDAEKEEAKRKQKQLEDEGKYKEIADALQAKLDAAELAAKEASTKLLQRDVATKTGLPIALADRLKGDTEDEMLQDAKNILAALPKPAAPNINANSGAGGAPAAGQLSDAEKKELGARLGVNPKYMT